MSRFRLAAVDRKGALDLRPLLRREGVAVHEEDGVLRLDRRIHGERAGKGLLAAQDERALVPFPEKGSLADRGEQGEVRLDRRRAEHVVVEMSFDIDRQVVLRAEEPHVVDAVPTFQEAERDPHAQAVHRRLDDRARPVRHGEVEVVAQVLVVLLQAFGPSRHSERQAQWTGLVQRLVCRHSGDVDLAADSEVVGQRSA